VKIKELAGFLKSEVNGDPDLEIRSVSDIKDAKKETLIFLFDKKQIRTVSNLKELAAIVPDNVDECSARAWIKVQDVKAAMIKILRYLYPEPIKYPESFLDERENSSDFKSGENVKIAKDVFIGKDCVFGNNVKIFPLVYIGNEVEIGDNTVIYPNSVILDKVKIGRDVMIYPGVVVGSDGFGYHPVDGKLEAIPHIGKVIIGDRVEIGALSMIDRGTIGDTIIGEGAKIDNSVHIAHNVKIGKNVIILAQVGVAGSSTIGDNVIIAGQVGISDHIKIGDGAKIAAKSGVVRNIRKDEIVFGYPADKKFEVLRGIVYSRKLPELFKRVETLEKNR
jgi:UDP-3-O-[3-hydroxymyristoyl] glucosamine N-acyltransferase